MSDRRIDERLDVIWPARIEAKSGELECGVADVSTAGAMVVGEINLDIDEEVLLVIPGIGEFAAEVAWAEPGRYGLKIMIGPDLLLKKYAELSGEYPSRHPADSPSGDPLDPDLHNS